MTRAPSLPGDVIEWQLNGENWVFLQSGSHLGVEVTSTWAASRAAPRPSSAAQGPDHAQVHRDGPLLVLSYGAIGARGRRA